MQNFQFSSFSENLGDLLVSHKERTKDADIISVIQGGITGKRPDKEILCVTIPFETKPANALKLIFDGIDALDYSGE